MADFINLLRDSDLEQIKNKGISLENLQKQYELFVKGVSYLDIIEAATVKNGGIKALTESTLKYYNNNFTKYNQNLKITKFVPASGAATRMFKDLYDFLENDNAKVPEKIFSFIKNLQKYAFYEDFLILIQKNNLSIDDLSYENIKKIISLFLNSNGLNYGNLPKGLLKFHKYHENSRTPIEEHISEAIMYANTFYGSKIHFTASPEHLDNFKKEISNIIPKYEQKFNTTIFVELSIQEPATDTIAVNIDNTPFRDKNDKLVFRPAGHGALIHNLNNLNADLIFVKNIDNIVPDCRKELEVSYKKALAGILIEYQTKIFEFLNALFHQPSLETIQESFNFLVNNLNVKIFFNFNDLSRTAKIDFLIDKMDRPIRVCGMVKNTGEPGGGPFFVKHADNSASLQIVEKAQIDISNINAKQIFELSTHFNPVDIVFSPKRFNGDKFDLTQYVDENTAFISEKSKEGRILKALELPGLWNGAMSNWNTIFVEVPLETFNPVKTVFDLLREAHLNN